MRKITIEIDADVLQQRLEEEAVKLAINQYFECEDMFEVRWDERQKFKAERLNKIINQVDWEKLPETMKQSMVKEFVDKYILRK